MYEIFAKLLEERGEKTINVARATGISNGTFSDWKNGRSKPNPTTLKKIADYFGVSVDYLITGETADERYYLDEQTSQIAQDIFENKELRLLFDSARDADPDDLKAVHDMLLALKRKEMKND